MKSFSVLLIVIFLSACLHAQTILWQKTIGGLDRDDLTLVKSTPDSGVLVGGFSYSGLSGNKTDDNISASPDYWVIKLDKSGNIQWQNAIGGDDVDELTTSVVCSDGGYLLGGHSSSDSSGDKNSNIYFGGIIPTDIWLLKLDQSGNISWQKNIGGNGVDVVWDMKQTADGGFIIGGSSSSNISGDKTENSFGIMDKSDFWILKLDSIGNIQWQRTLGGDQTDVVRAIQQTFDGGYIIAGDSDSPLSGNKTDAAHMWAGYYYEDYWVIKLDSSGNTEWQKVIGGDYYDIPSSVLQTTDGNYMVGGDSYSDITYEKTVATKGGYDYWIVKLDQVGNIIWQKGYGGSGTEAGGKIGQRPNGNFVLGGTSDSPVSGDKTENSNGLHDIWFLNLDAYGNILWQKTIGGSGGDYSYFHDFNSSGDSYIGTYSNSGISGDKTESGYGDFDYWVLKINGLESYVHASAFLDLNANTVKDLNEPDFYAGNFKIEYDSITKYVNATAAVSEIVDTGKVYYDFIPDYNYFNIFLSKDSNQALINAVDTIFCALQPFPNITDLGVHIIPDGPVRPGFISHYLIKISNFGSNTIPNATIKLSKHPNQDYLSSVPAYTNLIADSIWWNMGTLLPFSDTVIALSLENLPPPVNAIGDTNLLSVILLSVPNDQNAGNNHYDLSQIFIGSYDPNNKIENYAGVMPYFDALNGEQITYVVNFQNTGSDTAFNIFIRDTLDEKTDHSSFRMLSSSHSYCVTANGKYLQWNFDNILLIDSLTNEPGSHGYICYQLKTKPNVQKNDVVRNSAAIFFDFNLPVYTNSTFTKLIDLSPTSTSTYLPADEILYPNPAENLLYFKESAGLKNARLQIFDIKGHIISSSGFANPLDISGLSNGMYILQISTKENKTNYKFEKR